MSGLDRNELGVLLLQAGLSVGRDHALACLLALNGLRVSEAIGTDVDDLGLERGHHTLQIVRYGWQESRGDKSVSLSFGKRNALDEPSTDGPPWPFGYLFNGLVTRPRLSLGVFLVVLARNGTDPRLVARCPHFRIVQRVSDSAMRSPGVD